MKGKIVKLALVFIFFSGLLFFTVPHRAAAQVDRGCDDSVEQWYECWQKLSDVDRFINTWCNQADPSRDNGGTSKRDQCKEALLNKNTGINYSPRGLRNPAACAQGGSSAYAIKTQCWVLIRRGSPWYSFLEQFRRDCGFEEPERECKDEVIGEFLEANGWNTPDGGGARLPTDADNRKAQDTPFIARISTYSRWLIIGIGVLSVFSIVIAAIQYSAAQDNPQAVAGAKTRINNVIIGILIYLTMFGLLQWLIPGGVF